MIKLSTRLLCYLAALFISIASYSQSTPTLGSCPEGFEGEVFPPAGWAIFNNGVGLGQSWKTNSGVTVPPVPPMVYQGVNAAYIDRENVGPGTTTEDWLATPRLTVPANGELRFFTRRTIAYEYNTSYLIKVSTDPIQNNMAAFNNLQGYTGLTLCNTFNVYEEKTIDLSTYAGQQVYIAFVRTHYQPDAGLSGDRWLVDAVRVVPKCPTPSLSVSQVTLTSALLSWQNVGTGQYVLEYGLAGFAPGTGTTVNLATNSYAISNLLPGTIYQFAVRPKCTDCGDFIGTWTTRLSFSTTPLPVCEPPVNLSAVLNGTTATLSWVEPGPATSWQVVVEPYGQTSIPSGTVINTTSNPYTITGLAPDTIYRFFVKSVCAPDFTSTWRSAMIGNYVLPNPCLRDNPEKVQQVKSLFINLLNDIISTLNNGGTIDSSYNSPQFQALIPFITDPNPGIYNFSYLGGNIKFSFAPHIGKGTREDVIINNYNQIFGLITDFNLDTFYSPDYFLENVRVFFEKENSGISVKHIDFCQNYVKPCPKKDMVSQLFINLLNHLHEMVINGDEALIIDGFDCPQLAALRPYLTDPNARIYNFHKDPFKFSFHPQQNPLRNSLERRDDWFDVYIDWPGDSPISSIDISGFSNPAVFLS
jgi:hypothetical protein